MKLARFDLLKTEKILRVRELVGSGVAIRQRLHAPPGVRVFARAGSDAVLVPNVPGIPILH